MKTTLISNSNEQYTEKSTGNFACMAKTAQMNDTDLSLRPYVLLLSFCHLAKFSLSNSTKFTHTAYAVRVFRVRNPCKNLKEWIKRYHYQIETEKDIMKFASALIALWFIGRHKKVAQQFETHDENICLAWHTCVLTSPKKPHDNLALDQEIPPLLLWKPLRFIGIAAVTVAGCLSLFAIQFIFHHRFSALYLSCEFVHSHSC